MCHKPIKFGEPRDSKYLHTKCLDAYKVKYKTIPPHEKSESTIINYTLEQFVAEQQRSEKIIRTLEKITNVMEKFEKKLILDDFSRKRLEKYTTELGVRLQKLEKKK